MFSYAWTQSIHTDDPEGLFQPKRFHDPDGM